jgi:hypothetical protein
MSIAVSVLTGSQVVSNNSGAALLSVASSLRSISQGFQPAHKVRPEAVRSKSVGSAYV